MSNLNAITTRPTDSSDPASAEARAPTSGHPYDDLSGDLKIEKQVSSISNADSLVKDVWINNFFSTMETISKLVDDYNYIAMDTEFPGTVYIP